VDTFSLLTASDLKCIINSSWELVTPCSIVFQVGIKPFQIYSFVRVDMAVPNSPPVLKIAMTARHDQDISKNTAQPLQA
jgi:hypothetical protein